MSCFWQALCRKVPGLKKHRPSSVIRALKSVNCEPKDVRWDGKLLSPKECKEFVEWIDGYDPSNFSQGHDTSICDPFLALVCQVFAINITHHHTGFAFENGKRTQVCSSHYYKHPKATQDIAFKSSVGHFT